MVRGGLMRVVVLEVVAELDLAVIDEKLGSTKFAGACGESPLRAANITPVTISPIAASPAMLAPSTLAVEWCHGVDASTCRPECSSSSLAPVTGTDPNRDEVRCAGSAQLG